VETRWWHPRNKSAHQAPVEGAHRYSYGIPQAQDISTGCKTSDAEGTKLMTRKGGSAAPGHLPSTHAARGGRVRARSLPRRSAAADSCSPSHPHLRSLPGQPFPSGQRQPDIQPSPAINRGRLLNGRVQVAAYHIPHGWQRDCRRYLTQRKPFF